MANNWQRQFIIVDAVMLAQGKTKGNLEYSSTMFRKYWFLSVVGRGPLKSMFNLSKGWVALMSEVFSGV